MVYNMGTNDHPIGEIGVKVNDNAYHVVRFTRSGANSTIQIDDYNVQTNHPEGNDLSFCVRKMLHVMYIWSVQIGIVTYVL
jgi:leucine-rich repeat transmembrane neuronal protein 1/2